MLDIRFLREQPETVRASQRIRGEDPDLVDVALRADEHRRTMVGEYEALRNEQKTAGKEVAKASGERKQELLVKSKQMADDVKAAEAAQRQADEQLRAVLFELSNIVIEGVPAG
ncbi:MAG TPA: serine--tRNA ligase, partial [Actinomycetes bacterium]|nr:serine--tRNA ligase [Actinomycetes bacterium]